MASKLNGNVLTFAKFAAPFLIFALAFATWCGRLEARVDAEVERRQHYEVESLNQRRYNEAIMGKLEKLAANQEWIIKSLERKCR